MALVIIASRKQNAADRLHRLVHPFCKDHDLEVATAGSCEDALASAAESGAPAILIIDSNLSEQDCNELAGTMRQRYPATVSISLGGEPDTDDGDLEPAITFNMSRSPEPDDLLTMLDRAYRVHLVRAENIHYRRMMSQELEWAAELQNAVLGRELPEDKRIEFGVHYQPLPELSCGGDYYEVIAAGADRFLMLIGDVAGHGFRGALVTVIMKAVSDRIQLKPRFHEDPNPGLFLTDWSDQIRLELGSQSDMLVTAGAALIDLGAMTLEWASAGHLPAHIVSADSLRRINTPGPAFGVTSGAKKFSTKKADLAPGDRICLFTDGLIETERGPLSKVALAEILIKSRGSANYGQTVLTTALKATEREAFSDDVTLLTAEIAE